VNGRDLSAGLVVLGVRAGLLTYRVVVLPIRVVARTPVAGPLVLEAGKRISRDGSDARTLVRVRAEAATSAALTAPQLERMLDTALAAPLPDTVVRRLVDQVLASPELDRVVEHVASSPAVRAAVMNQTSSFADEVAARVRERAARLDDAAERTARSLFRRSARAHGAPYGGLATRLVAFTVDLVVLATAFLVVAGLAGLGASLVGDLSGVAVAVLLGVAWTLAAAGYFIFFWSTAGQTPGMRVMRQRVACGRGDAVGVGRAAIRFVVLTFGALVVLAGVPLILLDDRRRGLHDVLAGTVVMPVAAP
jgi:uncharacterized RDD family membrane protein YckC